MKNDAAFTCMRSGDLGFFCLVDHFSYLSSGVLVIDMMLGEFLFSLWWSWAVVLVPSEDSISLKSSWTRQSQRCRFLEEAAGGDRRRLILQTWQVEDLRNRFERSGQTVHSTFRLQSICHWGCPQTHFEAEGRSEGEKGTEEKQKRLLFQKPKPTSQL